MKCPKCQNHSTQIVHATGHPTHGAIIIETRHRCACGHEWIYGRKVNEPGIAPVYYRSFGKGGCHA